MAAADHAEPRGGVAVDLDRSVRRGDLLVDATSVRSCIAASSSSKIGAQ